jgi:hypothetical protein
MLRERIRRLTQAIEGEADVARRIGDAALVAERFEQRERAFVVRA